MNPVGQRLRHLTGVGANEVALHYDGWGELFVNVAALPGESPVDVFSRYFRTWEKHLSLRIVHRNVLGRLGSPAGHMALYRLSHQEWPANWTQPHTAAHGQVFGIQAHAVSCPTARPLFLRGHKVGVTYENEWLRHCVLSGLRPENCQQTPLRQARAVLDEAEVALVRAGLALADVYRTWFYLEDIRSWHGEFQDFRDVFLRSRGDLERPPPVSSEVGGKNGQGAAVVADLLAMRPKCAEAQCFGVTDLALSGAVGTGQKLNALAYNLPGQRRLFIAGTAVPHPSETLSRPEGAATTQIVQTLNAVLAVLRSQGMGWRDTVRGLAYFSRWEDAVALEDWRATQQLEHWPVLAVQTELARDDLRFGLELDAVRLG